MKPRRAIVLLAVLVVTCGWLVFPARVVADEADAAPAASGTLNSAGETAGLGQRSQREVTVGEQLSFREQQVQEQMAELEQRMFRLSEALKQLEPENSSRLIIGLKYAREELILHQMKAVQEALAAASLKGAVAEQKQLMAKLDRLQQLLLSTDLDFEMRLQRLRQIRETLRRLDTVIREESREEKLSRQASEAEKRRAELAKRKATLAELVRRQQQHNDENAPLAKRSGLDEAARGSVAALAKAQQATQGDTKSLAAELQDGASPKNLVDAVGHMESAVGALEKTAPGDAQPSMEKALEDLQRELDDVTRQEEAAARQLAEEQFDEMRKDQQANRGATDDVSEMTRQLGSNGTAALAELLRASGNMSGAESAFGNSEAGAGNGEQSKALASLNYAKELLAEEAERLARQLRAEVKKRVMDGLAQMLEMQTDVRQRTEALAPAVERRSREALAGLTALAGREEKITATAQELINIVEETEFGIALPAALAAVRDATENVGLLLAAGDASAEVVKAEKQIEADLKAMLEVVSEMTDANSRRGQRGGNSPRDQRRELNRIISELKMLRLLEQRVRDNTQHADTQRAKAAPLKADLRRRIEQLEGRQSDIQEAAELLAIERGDELPESP